jgi:hypothetical protein
MTYIARALRAVLNSHHDAFGYQMIHSPHRLVSSAFPFVDRHWHTSGRLQQSVLYLEVLYGEVDFPASKLHGMVGRFFDLDDGD